MKKLITCFVLIVAAASGLMAQRSGDGKRDREAINEIRQQARQEIVDAKRQAQTTSNLAPADFNDPDSFGKNVKFLGSLYAGTVYVYHSCDPQILSDELGLVLASDDHCVENSPASPMATTEVFDPVWQVTIPGKTVDNVIYPMLNNGVGYDFYGSAAGQAGLQYTPRLTIESVALNDPLAINPNTGLPMNGSFTTSLAGSKTRFWSVTAGSNDSSFENFASVSGRGLSRSYFAALGLPNSVINKLFNKPMTLKFGIRVRVRGPIDFSQFFYTFRLLGN